MCIAFFSHQNKLKLWTKLNWVCTTQLVSYVPKTMKCSKRSKKKLSKPEKELRPQATHMSHKDTEELRTHKVYKQLRKLFQAAATKIPATGRGDTEILKCPKCSKYLEGWGWAASLRSSTKATDRKLTHNESVCSWQWIANFIEIVFERSTWRMRNAFTVSSFSNSIDL